VIALYSLARLACARIAHRPLRSLLVMIGIGAAALMLAASLAGSLLTEDRAVQRAIGDLPVSERTARAFWGGFGGPTEEPFGSLDRVAREALGRALGAEPTAGVVFTELRENGNLALLGALDGLPKQVRLRSGRLPAHCRRGRCELLQIGGGRRIRSFLHLPVVGTAELDAEAPVPATGVGDETGAQAPALLLANGAEGLTQQPDLDLFYRTYAWTSPLDGRSLHVWELGDLDRRLGEARVALQLRSDVFRVAAPEVELDGIRQSARISGRRLLLVAGQGVSLLLVFALLVAAGLRNDFDAAASRLLGFGATRMQVFAEASLEVGALAMFATAAGWAGGVLVSFGLAALLDTPAAPVLTRSVLSAPGLLAAAGLALAATAVVLAGARAGAWRTNGRSVTLLDLAGLAAAGTVGLALAQGAADPEALAGERGSGIELLLLPSLVSLAVAAACVRLVGPALRACERLLRRAGPVPRLALLSLVRNPGRASVAVVFGVTSVGIGLFAETYRATLGQNLSDQAAFAVPLDYVLREDLGRLVSVQRAAPPESYRALGESYPVLRASGDVARLESSAGLTVLGVPAEAIPRLRGWRADFADEPRSELARRIRPDHALALGGLRLSREARELVLETRIEGDRVALEASIQTPRGDFETVDLGEPLAGRRTLRAAIPSSARGGLVVGLTVDLTQLGRFGGGHRETGDKPGQQARADGLLRLGRLREGGGGTALTPRGSLGGWEVAGPADLVSAGASSLAIRYAISRERAVRLHPPRPDGGQPPPVLASPGLAAAVGRDGTLPLRVVGEPLTVRVVGTIRRFPTVVEGDVIVGDVTWLETALDVQAPPVGVPGEVWVRGGPEVAGLLARPPFDVLEAASRRSVEAGLRADPLARGTLVVLTLTALVALALALIGLALVVFSEQRDRAGELADLEAQGLDPAALRRQLRLRAAAIALAGALGGLVAGALLSALVVGFVTLTANATEPVPPLVLSIDWVVIGLAAAAVTAVTVGLVCVLTRRAFAGTEVARPAAGGQ